MIETNLFASKNPGHWSSLCDSIHRHPMEDQGFDAWVATGGWLCWSGAGATEVQLGYLSNIDSGIRWNIFRWALRATGNEQFPMAKLNMNRSINQTKSKALSKEVLPPPSLDPFGGLLDWCWRQQYCHAFWTASPLPDTLHDK